MLTPDKIAKESEHSHQAALFCYCAAAMNHGFAVADAWAQFGPQSFISSQKAGVPELRWLHAIHNQGHGDAVRGAKAKAEGVKAGVADVFLPVCKWRPDENIVCAGLYIEMKKPSEKPVKATSKGGVSDEQKAFAMFVEKQGYQWNVCYSWQEAVEVIKEYLK